MKITPSLEAEKALIGAVLLDCALLAEAGHISPEDFFADNHRAIWRAILSMPEQFDLVTVAEKLRGAAGGAAYLSATLDGVPIGSKMAARTYANLVREKAKIRQLASIAQSAIEAANSPDASSRELAKSIAAAIQPILALPAGARNIFASASEFGFADHEEISWLVPGVIQAGANGFIVAAPKVGKSWLAAELCIALAEGRPWLGLKINRRHKVALISREDNPALTRWRLARLSGEGLAAVDGWLYVNTRAQSKTFSLTNDAEHAEMLSELKRVKPELAIFDVMNVMHGSDENDNTEMVRVLRRLSEIHAEAGCAVCVVHHFNKLAEGSLTARMRGSSAIAGWAEWMVGVEKFGDRTRRVTFELKACEPQEPIFFVIERGLDESMVLRTVDKPTEPPKGRRSLA